MRMLKKDKFQYAFSYWQAFLIPVLVMLVGCIGNGIFPFGNRSFLRNDLYNQYMPFFQALYDKVWQGEGLTYGFELGLGSGLAALYGYYLASPTNWLVLLCPRPLIAEFIMVSIVLKMGASSVSFAYYLRKRFGKEDVGILMFSSAYGLSGFMAAYQWNIMWLDVVIMAPLVLWALEELIEKGKGIKYCGLLALSITANFYLSIMLCIFLVLYFVMVIIWKPWRIKIRSSLLFGWYSLLAGGISAAMLLPVYFALSGTEFHEFNFPDKAKWYMDFIEELTRHCMGVTMKLQADHWPNIYCSVAAFLLVPLFLFNKKISWKSKITKLLLVAVLLVSFALNYLDFIWHGLNYPDSLPGRQAFLYIWLILIMGYEVYSHQRALRTWHVIVSAVFAYGIVIASWIFKDVEGTEIWSYILTLVFITIYAGMLLGRCRWNYPRVREQIRSTRFKGLFRNHYLGIKALVLLLVVTELAANMYLTSIHTVNRSNYMNHYKKAESAISWMKEYDNGLYRTEFFKRLTKNDSMMWNVNTATVFSSTVNAKVVELYEALGMGTTRVSYWHQGASPLVSAMLGVKYMLGKDDSMENDLYELLFSEETGYLYRCKYSLPMGYVIAPVIEDNWDLTTYNPVKAQNKLCRLLGIGDDLFVPVSKKKQDDRTYHISVSEDSYVFVYLGKNSLTNVKANVGEKQMDFSQVSFDYLLDLGLVSSDAAAVVEVVEEDEKFNTFQAYALNMPVLEQAIDLLGKTPLEITEHKQGYIKGDITLQESGKLVLAIPWEKGWHLLVDGKEQEIETFKDAFLAVTLEEGRHQIELQFETPGLKTGIWISSICIIIYLLCFCCEYKKRFSNKK